MRPSYGAASWLIVNAAPPAPVTLMEPERAGAGGGELGATVKLIVVGITGPEVALVIVICVPKAVAVHAPHTPGGMPGTGVRLAVNEPPAAGTLLSVVCPPTVSVATQKATGCGF